jgi:hypothetical protein
MFSLQTNQHQIKEAKQQFASLPLPAILLPDVISSTWSKQLRARLEESGWQHFSLAHRGDYLYNDSFQARALFDELRDLAQQITGDKLLLQSIRWTRWRHRSYSLLRDDISTGRQIELQLDISSQEVPNAELYYCHRRQVYAALPARPGLLSLVARGLTVQRYQRYLTHQANGEVLRLQMLFEINAL